MAQRDHLPLTLASSPGCLHTWLRGTEGGGGRNQREEGFRGSREICCTPTFVHMHKKYTHNYTQEHRNTRMQCAYGCTLKDTHMHTYCTHMHECICKHICM